MSGVVAHALSSTAHERLERIVKLGPSWATNIVKPCLTKSNRVSEIAQQVKELAKKA